VSALRTIAEPFVVAPPAGARVRTRLRVPDADAAVLREAGEHLGSLASADLAARCAEGRLDAKGRAGSRRMRKQALTAQSSSRWAGALTRTSEDAYRLAYRNLLAERHSLLARIKRIETRSAVPAGLRAGRVPGYPTRAGRHSKTVRVQALRTRLTGVEQQLQTGRVSVCRGGKTLLHKRNNLGAAGLTEAQWREQWTASRLFLTADIENLDFGDARHQGREHTGNRPSKGRRGRAFRHQVTGIPTARFRDRLTHMACNAGMAVIAVDPAYTSRWGAQHWLAPMRQHHPRLTGHHAAAFVIGRRGLGLRARRRASGNPPAPEDAARSTQARHGTEPKAGTQPGNPPPRRTPGSRQARRPEGPDGPRQATRRPKTVRGRPPHRTRSC
jgi:hypothetical protein